MGLNGIFNTIVTVEIYLIIIAAYKYDAVIRDEDIFSPCEFDNIHYIDEYLDMSNMHFNYLENGSVYFYGYSTLIKGLGMEEIPITFQLFKKSRDNWVSTVYNLNRPDMCKTIFDSTELWHNYVKDIPIEERTCPFHEGQKFLYNVTTDMEIDLPDPRAAGEYKVQISANLIGINEVFCANIFVEFYKK